MQKERVAIVGAGIAGLTAAAILGPRAQVTVFERDDRSGGKIRQEILGNRAIDCGPTVFTLKPIFDQIFAACGERLEDHLALTPLDVLARHAWPDGSRLDLYADIGQSAEAIAAFAGKREADAYLGYVKMARRVWETLYHPLIYQPDADFARMMVKTPPHQLIRLNPYISLWRELSGRFRDERLRQLFGRYTTYCGSSPFKAPGVLSMIAHIEQQGVWSIDGGMKALAEALLRVAIKRGATFEYGAEIEEIEKQGGQVTGVRGVKSARAPIVLFNGDIAALERGQVGSDTHGSRQAPAKKERSQSAVTLCFSGESEGLPLHLHNVFFSSNYRAEFDNVFERGTLPDEPTVYVFAPDHDQPNDGTRRFFCLMNAPPHGDTNRYSEEDKRQCQSKILSHLKRCGLTLTPDPASMVTTTPAEFAERFPATGGALFGQPIHGWRASFQRPGIRTETKGLYCAGGSVHPGSGVPMAALSGLMAAQAIIRDYALT